MDTHLFRESGVFPCASCGVYSICAMAGFFLGFLGGSMRLVFQVWGFGARRRQRYLKVLSTYTLKSNLKAGEKYSAWPTW